MASKPLWDNVAGFVYRRRAVAAVGHMGDYFGLRRACSRASGQVLLRCDRDERAEGTANDGIGGRDGEARSDCIGMAGR